MLPQHTRNRRPRNERWLELWHEVGSAVGWASFPQFVHAPAVGAAAAREGHVAGLLVEVVLGVGHVRGPVLVGLGGVGPLLPPAPGHRACAMCVTARAIMAVMIHKANRRGP